MGFLSDKPYTAITANIERLCGRDYDEEDISDLPDLVQIIGLRPDGPVEAARAIRKKLKYGTTHEQLRALTILDTLVQNGDSSLIELYRDSRLLDRLATLALDSASNKRSKTKMRRLLIGWHSQLKHTPGFEKLSEVYYRLPESRHSRQVSSSSRHHDHDDDVEDFGENNDKDTSFSSSRTRRFSHGTGTNSGSNSRSHSRNVSRDMTKEQSKSTKDSKKRRSKQETRPVHLNLLIERPKIKQSLADATSYSTNLANALHMVNPATELATENERATEWFEKCKRLRRQVLRYIHSVQDEELLGPLIHANEELVNALKAYDAKSRDSENEDWRGNDDITRRTKNLRISDDDSQTEEDDYSESSEEEDSSSSVKKNPPPLPTSPKPPAWKSPIASVQQESDSDDPFADSHQVKAKPIVKPMW